MNVQESYSRALEQGTLGRKSLHYFHHHFLFPPSIFACCLHTTCGVGVGGGEIEKGHLISAAAEQHAIPRCRKIVPETRSSTSLEYKIGIESSAVTTQGI